MGDLLEYSVAIATITALLWRPLTAAAVIFSSIWMVRKIKKRARSSSERTKSAINAVASKASATGSALADSSATAVSTAYAAIAPHAGRAAEMVSNTATTYAPVARDAAMDAASKAVPLVQHAAHRMSETARQYAPVVQQQAVDAASRIAPVIQDAATKTAPVVGAKAGAALGFLRSRIASSGKAPEALSDDTSKSQ